MKLHKAAGRPYLVGNVLGPDRSKKIYTKQNIRITVQNDSKCNYSKHLGNSTVIPKACKSNFLSWLLKLRNNVWIYIEGPNDCNKHQTCLEKNIYHPEHDRLNLECRDSMDNWAEIGSGPFHLQIQSFSDLLLAR